MKVKLARQKAKTFIFSHKTTIKQHRKQRSVETNNQKTNQIQLLH